VIIYSRDLQKRSHPACNILSWQASQLQLQLAAAAAVVAGG